MAKAAAAKGAADKEAAKAEAARLAAHKGLTAAEPWPHPAVGAPPDDEQDGEDNASSKTLGATSSPVSDAARCWGLQLKQLAGGAKQSECDPDFVMGKNHLRNRFCSVCRSGFVVSVSRVRAIDPAKAEMVRPTASHATHRPRLP